MEHVLLVVGHRDARYALPAARVNTVAHLPWLAAPRELPPFIAGVVNIRGRVVPVMDLGPRFGHGAGRPHPEHHLVLVEQDGAHLALWVHDLVGTVTVTPDALAEAGTYQDAGGRARFVRGAWKVDGGLVMELDIHALLREAPLELPPPDDDDDGTSAFSVLPPDEAELFRARALDLARAPAADDKAPRTPHAVIRVGGELFAFPVDVVREFAHLRGLTPIPCTPAHVVGNVNLRGDILTIVDVRAALGVPAGGAPAEVAVLEFDRVRVGVLADAVVDLVSLADADVAPMPVASRAPGREGCTGITTASGTPVTVVDIRRLLSSPALSTGDVHP